MPAHVEGLQTRREGVTLPIAPGEQERSSCSPDTRGVFRNAGISHQPVCGKAGCATRPVHMWVFWGRLLLGRDTESDVSAGTNAPLVVRGCDVCWVH